MTEDDVRAAAERLIQFHERFAPHFGREQAQDHAYTYTKGLMVCPERKSIEPIALNVGDGQVSALQKFINSAPWDHGDIQAELQAVFVDELIPTAVGSPICQVGVFLVGVTPGGSALLDHQLYLPEAWCEPGKAAARRRQKVHVPESVTFGTKPRIAAGLIRQTVALGIVALDWITADEEYGKNGGFLHDVEELGVR